MTLQARRLRNAHRLAFTVVLSSALAAFPLSAKSAPAAPPPAPQVPVAWQKTFPGHVNWYVRTSLGVLLVRCGKMLTAVDGENGATLWSMDDLKVGGGKSEWTWPQHLRGYNMLEVPGHPILLINRARLAGAATGQLLAIDIWTGKLLWQKPEFDDLLETVPVDGSKRVLLVTRQLQAKRMFVPYRNGARSYGIYSYRVGDEPFRPVLTLLEPNTGKIDWQSEYPRVFTPSYFDIREMQGELFLQERNATGATILAAVDEGTGKRLWEAEGKTHGEFQFLPDLELWNGKIVAGLSGVEELDAQTGKAAWSAKSVGQVSGLALGNGVIYAGATKGAFAVNANNGELLWRVKTEGPATNPLLLDSGKSVVLCDSSNLLIVDSATGKVTRKLKLDLGQGSENPGPPPHLLMPIGTKYVVALTIDKTFVYDINLPALAAVKQAVTAFFPPVSFFSGQYLPEAGAKMPFELGLKEEIKNNWTTIVASATDSPMGQRTIERLHRYLELDNDGALTAFGGNAEHWELWRLDPRSGNLEVREFSESQPDADLAAGLVYHFKDNVLTATQWNAAAAEALHSR